MDDLISRRDAIDTVKFSITYAKAIDVNTGEAKELFKEGNDALKKAVERLKEVPSAEPERKKGEWIEDKCSACGYKCSDCGYRVEPWDNTPYCPNCGARMVIDE